MWPSLSRRGSILSTSLARLAVGFPRPPAAFDLVHAHGLKAGWTTSLARAEAVGAHRAQRCAAGPGWRDGADAPPAGAAACRARADAVIADVGPARLDARRACAHRATARHPARGSVPRAAPWLASEVRLAHGVAEGTSLLVGVGWLHHQKGWPVLLEAARPAAASTAGAGCDRRGRASGGRAAGAGLVALDLDRGRGPRRGNARMPSISSPRPMWSS